MLYPLKFEPIYKERIWGGSKLRTKYDRMCPEGIPIGESWELSGLYGDISVVSNGDLAGNEIDELIEVYMGELVGDRVYNKYGVEFPIIIKLLDAQDILSVQVHPDDTLAEQRHGAYGKNEMWYVIDAEEGAKINIGFNKKVTEKQYLYALEKGEVASLLKEESAEKGSMFFIPSGTIHALGKGVMVVEVQQASDITYRVFDWNRLDGEGNERELHTELAMKALNFDAAKGLNVTKKTEYNTPVEINSCEQFTTNIIEIDGAIERDYSNLDSFVVYVCLEGGVIIECEGGSESIVDTETVLLPAVFEYAKLKGKGRLLEVYMSK